jgi:hypothetical protein
MHPDDPRARIAAMSADPNVPTSSVGPGAPAGNPGAPAAGAPYGVGAEQLAGYPPQPYPSQPYPCQPSPPQAYPAHQQMPAPNPPHIANYPAQPSVQAYRPHTMQPGGSQPPSPHTGYPVGPGGQAQPYPPQTQPYAGQPQPYAPQPNVPQMYTPAPPQQYTQQMPPGHPTGPNQHGGMPYVNVNTTTAYPSTNPPFAQGGYNVEPPTTKRAEMSKGFVARSPHPAGGKATGLLATSDSKPIVVAAPPTDAGYGAIPEMPGGWYQPPSTEELHEAARTPPPVPLGAGVSGIDSGYAVIAGVGSDPLVSSDANTWLNLSFAALARSWRTVVPLNVLAFVGIVISMLAWSKLIANFEAGDFPDSVGAGFAYLLRVLVVFGSGAAGALLSVNLATAGSFHAMALDADENRSAFRLASSIAFVSKSCVRIFIGTLGYLFTMFVIAVGCVLGFVLLVKVGVVKDGITVLAAQIALAFPPLYMLVAASTSLVGISAFEEGAIVSRCRQRLRGRWWSMFGRAILLGVLWIGLSIAVRALGGDAFLGRGSDGVTVASATENPVPFVVYAIGYVAMLSLQAAGQLVAYAELRSRAGRDGVTASLAKAAR